jgi:pimeloyl-ACP methyl ester carboxylesterase
MTNPQTFLFVHGLWHGAWVWDEVVQRVRDAGHDAIAMNLPGRAGDPRPPESITLATHADAICALARACRRKIILVAHSTTGVYVTQAAEHCSDTIEKIVYVSAFVPTHGQTAGQLQAMGGQYGGQVGQYVVRQPPYVFFKADTPLDALWYGDVEAAVVARARAMLVAEPMRPLGDPVSITDASFGRIPRDYIGFQNDNAIKPAFQEVMYTATPCNVIKLPGSHTHWLADPGGFVQALVRDYGGTVDLSPPPPPRSAIASP